MSEAPDKPAILAAPESASGFRHWMARNAWRFVLLFAGVVAFARQGYRGPAQWILGNPILRYLGRISYGMYLYHLFVMAFLFRDAARYSVMFQSRGWALMLFGTVITVALASLSWYLLEAPINRLKQRFPFPQ